MFTDPDQLDPEKTTVTGAQLGALLGGLGAGAYGSYKGRRAGVGEPEAEKESSVKTATGEILTPALGAIPGLSGPTLAGLSGGVTAPEGKGWSTATRSAGGSLLGQILGGTGGAALGGASGYGIGHLIKALGGDVDPERAAAIGASLGGLGGVVGGGAYGTHVARKQGLGIDKNKGSEKEGSYKTARAPTDTSDVASAALGGLPILGPAAAGLASGMTGPPGLRQTTGMATTGGAAAGQALGGLSGAALGAGLGAGGAALYNQYRDKSLMHKLFGKKNLVEKFLGEEDIDIGKATGIGALLGGGLGTVGGGIIGAHKGRGYGEERAERRDALKAQIIQAMRQHAAMRNAAMMQAYGQ